MPKQRKVTKFVYQTPPHIKMQCALDSIACNTQEIIDETTEPETVKSAIGPPFQVIHNDDIKNKNPECFWVQAYQLNGVTCYAFVGDDPNTNTINLDNYMSKESNYGQLVQTSPLVPTPFPYDGPGLVICPDATDQDVIALIEGTPQYIDFIAGLTAKFPLPAGAAYGVMSASLEQISGEPKRNVFCDVAQAIQAVNSQAQITVVGNGDTSLLTVGALFPYAKPQAAIVVTNADGSCATCTDAACQTVAGDIIANGAVGTAYNVDFCVTCYATPAK